MSEHTVPLSNRTVYLSLIIGTGGLTFFGIVPIVLGALITSGRINAAELGYIATAETIFTAVGMLLGLRALRSFGGRWAIVVAGIVMALANIAIEFLSNFGLIISAGSMAGLAQGVLVAVVCLSIGCSLNPARTSGIFLAVSVPPPLLLAYFLPSYLMPRFGNGAGLSALAVVGLVSSACALFIREDFCGTSAANRKHVDWTPLTIAALLGILLSSAGYGAAWAYVDLLGANHGLKSQEIGFALSVAIAGQFLVSALIGAIGWRLPTLKILLAVSALQTLIPILLQESGSLPGFTLLLTGFALMWQGATPFATELLAALDDSRRLAPLALPLQLAGLALGPLVVAPVAQASLSLILLIASGFYGLTLIAYIVVLVGRGASDTASMNSLEADAPGSV